MADFIPMSTSPFNCNRCDDAGFYPSDGNCLPYTEVENCSIYTTYADAC